MLKNANISCSSFGNACPNKTFQRMFSHRFEWYFPAHLHMHVLAVPLKLYCWLVSPDDVVKVVLVLQTHLKFQALLLVCIQIMDPHLVFTATHYRDSRRCLCNWTNHNSENEPPEFDWSCLISSSSRHSTRKLDCKLRGPTSTKVVIQATILLPVKNPTTNCSTSLPSLCKVRMMAETFAPPFHRATILSQYHLDSFAGMATCDRLQQTLEQFFNTWLSRQNLTILARTRCESLALIFYIVHGTSSKNRALWIPR